MGETAPLMTSHSLIQKTLKTICVWFTSIDHNDSLNLVCILYKFLSFLVQKLVCQLLNFPKQNFVISVIQGPVVQNPISANPLD